MTTDTKSAISQLKPVRKLAANLQIYDQVRQAIMGGQFRPGEVLRTRQVAEALNVSQMPVREAFHRLVAEQALENRPNRTIGLPTLTPAEFEELTEIRVQLEGLAAHKAALSITEKERNKIRSLQTKLEALTPQSGRSAYLDLNRQFHFAIYEASRSETLVRLIDQLWLRVGPLLNWSARRRENILGSRECHQAAIGALEKADAVAARNAIVKDIQDAATIVRGEMVEEIRASSKTGVDG